MSSLKKGSNFTLPWRPRNERRSTQRSRIREAPQRQPLVFGRALSGGAILEEKEKRAGLIADIHTDVVKGQILYEATAKPYFILALVGNEGVSRLTVGAAYNYYEFTGPLASRYTDADWQERVYKTPPQLPLKPFWYKALIAK